MRAGQSVTINGTGFGGANGTFAGTVAFSGTGITVNSVTKSSATQLTANVTLSATAATGCPQRDGDQPVGGWLGHVQRLLLGDGPSEPDVDEPELAGPGCDQPERQPSTARTSRPGATVAISGTGITVNSVTVQLGEPARRQPLRLGERGDRRPQRHGDEPRRRDRHAHERLHGERRA